MWYFYPTLTNKELILSELHFRNSSVCFLVSPMKIAPNKSLHICAELQCFVPKWICFWINILSQWCHDPFIKTVNCFVSKCLNRLNEWFNESLMKTETCCQLLVVLVSYLFIHERPTSKDTSTKTHSAKCCLIIVINKTPTKHWDIILSISHTPTFKLFWTQQTHTETCSSLLRDAWQMKTNHSEITKNCSKISNCMISSNWIES